MRLVLFSDLHLDAPFAWLGATGSAGSVGAARQRRDALRQTLVRITCLAVDVRADALLCGGDLYEHDRVTPDTAAFLRSLFASLHPLPIYIAPGNHDWLGPHSLYRRVDWSPNVHIFSERHLEPVTLAGGLTLWGAAHCAPVGTPNLLDGFRVDRTGVHLALFHGAEQGALSSQAAEARAAQEPHAPFQEAQIAAAGLHHACLGHYHRPRDTARLTYPGNPEPLAFGETGQRGAVVLTLTQDARLTRERHVVATTQTHALSLDVTGCASRYHVRTCLMDLLQPLRGLVRVTLHGALAPEVDLQPRTLAGVAPWLDGLAIQVGAVHPTYDFAHLAQELTVRGQFVRDVMASSLADEQRQRVLVTGLRALDSREDLDVV